MITADSLEQLQTFFEKAKQRAEILNRQLAVVEMGHYRVRSSNDVDWYDVYCGRNSSGFYVACTCRAGIEKKGCHHGYKAMIVHIANKKAEKLIAQEKQEKLEQKNAMYRKTEKESEKIGGMRI